MGTKVIQNCHDPVWNHEAEFDVPDGDERRFYIEVFDSDKVGKDTSLGNLTLDITDVLAMDGKEGQWFPLKGVKSGKVLLSADFLDDLGRKASDILPSLLKGGDPNDPYGIAGRKNSSDPSNKSGYSTGLGDDGDNVELPSGKARI